MKALTGPQPRPTLATAGVVTVWPVAHPTDHRGPVALHAAKSAPLNLLSIGDWTAHPYGDEGPELRRTGSVKDGILVPERFEQGLAMPMPLGAVVGSAVITDCVPIEKLRPGHPSEAPSAWRIGDDGQAYAWNIGPRWPRHITDQLPFGDFTPGRWALLLTDPKPTTQRCPWCWGATGPTEQISTVPRLSNCPVCRGARVCDPVPARGHPGLWEWNPT